MENLYEQTIINVEEGEVVKGTIIKIANDSILVDIGYKSEGTIPISEFRRDRKDIDLKEGDVIDVLVENKEDADGIVVLSKEKADKIKIWDDLNLAQEKDQVMQGRVTRRIKGGLTVDIGIPAFLPGSQIDIKRVKDLDLMIGEKIKVKIIKLNRKRGNIVVSRRAIIEEERNKKRSDTLSKIEEGSLIKGIVKNITEYGVFIDLGGIDGLLHVTDISWGRVPHPCELFAIGDEVEVKVLKFTPDNEKVSLGLKQKTPDPWQNADEKYVVGSKVTGKIVSLTDYGAFVELEEGIEGLIHISEMSWTRKVRHASRVVAVGEMVECIVLDVDKERKRLSLGMKQTEANPWLVIENKYNIGCIITGKVRNITDFGAFIELEEGIDGLIHISDMSWTKRIKHPSEILKKGEAVEAIILNIDTKNERLSLGLKQLTEDPWQKIIPEKYPVGMEVECNIVRLTDNGVIVSLEDGVDGFIHISEIGEDDITSPKEALKVGEKINAKIVRLDPDNRKIGLSIRLYEKELKNYGEEQVAEKEIKETNKKKVKAKTKKSEAEEKIRKPEEEIKKLKGRKAEETEDQTENPEEEKTDQMKAEQEDQSNDSAEEDSDDN
ncbi:MAG: 30S ribosomal protein S1 [bacterium]